MEDRVGELEKTIQALMQARIRGGGVYAEVIIGTEPNERQQIMSSARFSHGRGKVCQKIYS